MWTCNFRLTGLESHLQRHRKKTPRHPLHPARVFAILVAHLGLAGTLLAGMHGDKENVCSLRGGGAAGGHR